jgi:uncharacterized protein YdaU (DUF1376 family)
MSTDPYMPLYVADYLGDTRHLTTEQHGAYLLVLMSMWRAGGSLPDDHSKLARIAGTSLKKWRGIWATITEFFTVADGRVSQKRLSEERQKAEAIREKRASAGALGGAAKALKDKAAPVASATAKPYQFISGQEVREAAPKGALANADFDTWWVVYPEKVGKGAARKAWPAARSKASLETLIEGVRRYIASKPPDRSYCHPSKWLNDERWGDQPAPAPVPMARGSPQRRTVFDAADELLRQMDNPDARPAEDHSPDQAIGQRVPALVYSRPG